MYAILDNSASNKPRVVSLRMDRYEAALEAVSKATNEINPDIETVDEAERLLRENGYVKAGRFCVQELVDRSSRGTR